MSIIHVKYFDNRNVFVELTSEEVTAKRRTERRQFKLDRAAAIAAVAEEAETIFATEGRVITPALSGPGIPSAATWKPAPSVTEPPATPIPDEEQEPTELKPLEDIEHLQLTLQEAFFLAWSLGCLTILDPHNVLFPSCISYQVLTISARRTR